MQMLTIFLIGCCTVPSVASVVFMFALVVGSYLAGMIFLLWAIPKVFSWLKRMFTE